MPLVYKIDVVSALKSKGYTPTIIKTNHLIGESTMSKLRRKQPISWENLQTLCRLLECQPSELIEYIED